MDAHTGRTASEGSRVLVERECLVGCIVDQLRSRGFYLAHLDSHTGQVLTDVRWAAQLAGRAVGRRTRTYTSAVGKRFPGMVTVIVAPVESSSPAGVAGRGLDRGAIEDLLTEHATVGADNLTA